MSTNVYLDLYVSIEHCVDGCQLVGQWFVSVLCVRLLYNPLGPYPMNLIIINNSNMRFVVKGYSGIIGMPGLWFDSGITYYI